MRKMDEMERAHSLQAIRFTFLYTMIFEISYWMMECVRAGKFVSKDSIMFLLIITQGTILLISQFFLKGRTGDSKGVLGIVAAAILAAIALAFGFFFMNLGV